MVSFALNAKKAVKRALSLGAGVTMMGATIASAFAAGTLGDLPDPFVKSGKYQSLALVFGDTAASTDNTALSEISTKLGTLVTSSGGGGGTVTVTGGKEADVPLGKPLASSSGNDFDLTLEDDDISSLLDTTVSFQGTDYDVSEVVVVGGNETSGSLIAESSLTSNDDDYKTDVRMEIRKDALKYYYSFDETINLSKATSTNPLEIDW